MVSFTPSTTVYAVDRSISQFCRASEAKAVTSKTGVAISRQSKNSVYGFKVHPGVSSSSIWRLLLCNVSEDLDHRAHHFKEGLQGFFSACPTCVREFLQLDYTLSRVQGLLAFHKCSVSFRRAGEKYIELLYQVKKGNEVEA